MVIINSMTFNSTQSSLKNHFDLIVNEGMNIELPWVIITSM